MMQSSPGSMSCERKDEERLLLEAQRRKRARASLLGYAQAIDVPGAPVSDDPDEWLFHPVETGLAAHHKIMLQVMEAVITRKLPRAMFFLPPGSAKSTYGSVVAPTWAMGKWPGTKIILASYGSDLARKHGRRARQIARSPQYRRIFGAGLSSETSAADEWATTNGSEYLACGILAGVTGNRGHGLIIDDPVKGRQDADSEAIQTSTWNAYQDDLRTRLIPGGWEIIIQTRWNENDLSGRILPEKYNGESGLIRCRDGRDWYIVCLPAQCERTDDLLGRKIGEYIWPEWFPEEHFVAFKANSRTWNALFQQRPSPDEGTFFQKDWFKRFRLGQQPTNLHFYGSSDYAVSDGENDFTDQGVIAVDEMGDLWAIDWWYGQTASNVWINEQARLMKRWPLFAWFEEAGVIKKAVKPFQDTMLREQGVLCRREWIPSVVDKPTRARGFQARAASGKVHILEGEWGDRLIDQCLRFPTGANDDAVDVMSLFCRALDMAHPAIAPTPKRRPLTMFEKDMLQITGIDPRDKEEGQQQTGGQVWLDDMEESCERDRAGLRH